MEINYKNLRDVSITLTPYYMRTVKIYADISERNYERSTATEKAAI